MKPGDLVYVPTGRGTVKVVGVLVSFRDNPADVEHSFHNGGRIRQVADVFYSGKIITAWKHHVVAINETR